MSDNRNQTHDDDIDHEPTPVASVSRRQLTNRQKLALAGVILVVLLAFIWIGQLTRQPPQQAAQEVASGPATNYRAAPMVPVPAPNRVTAIEPSRVPAPEHKEMSPAESPIMAFSGGGGSHESEESAPEPHRAASPRAPTEPRDAESGLGGRMHATTVKPTRASLLPHPDLLVTKGTMLPCILETAISTELPGYVKCVLPQDVRSTTGNVVLLDRGTVLVGEIQSGLQAGQQRVFVLWDRAETPDHAVVELDSPGTDTLGRAGLSGAVNDHFWKKFGAAIMLTVIQGGLEAGAGYATNSGGSGNSGTGAFYGSFQQNNQQLANTALQASINIPPTLEKNEGDTISVFVARDLDFSDVYQLRANTWSHQ